jgi:hypothetical protein
MCGMNKLNLGNPAGHQPDAASAGHPAGIDLQARFACLSAALAPGPTTKAMLTKQKALTEMNTDVTFETTRTPEPYNDDKDNLVPSLRRPRLALRENHNKTVPSTVCNCNRNIG